MALIDQNKNFEIFRALQQTTIVRISLSKNKKTLIMDFNKEHYLARIRQKLQEDGVKLWISPYFVDNKTNVENLQVKTFLIVIKLKF
jgi:hypothetical protein